jgi:DNA polymerase
VRAVAENPAAGQKSAMDALALLRLQIEWGADEALEEAPVDRLAPASPRPLPVPTPAPAPAPALARVVPMTPPIARIGVPPPIVARARAAADAAGTLEALRTTLAGFDGCPLHATATNLVFADGNPESGLMLIGEAPGADEDRMGKPFVGASGRLLDKMLASIGLDRSRVLITNLIPWRPPGNRTPTDSEVLTCLPFLLRHIALVRPQRIVLLGAMATKAITGNTAGIRKLRGRWIELPVPGVDAPIRTLPMLHPAFLLRTPGAKRDAWADWLMLRRDLDGVNGKVTEKLPPNP